MLIADITWTRTQNPSHRKPNSQNIPKWSRNDRAVADNASLFCFLSFYQYRSRPLRMLPPVLKPRLSFSFRTGGPVFSAPLRRNWLWDTLSDSRSVTAPNCWIVYQRSPAGPVGGFKRRGKGRSREREVLPVSLLLLWCCLLLWDAALAVLSQAKPKDCTWTDPWLRLHM